MLSRSLSAFALASVFALSPAFAQKTPPPPPLPGPPVLKLSDPMPQNLFIELGKAINPATVNISTSQAMAQGQRDPMMEMLERFYGVRPQQRPRGRPQQQALGTGFVIREDGLIVTNAHVIRGADTITVSFDEKADKFFDAKLIGFDERSDIALLKITPDKKLIAAALGTSKDLQVGEWVAAFGNPFGHGHTMTKGIVSSIGRSIEEINKYPLIQTDASINPGNSGGPLVNSRGEVIGVNSAIDARAQGIGFAIPIDEVKRILPELESRGSLRKGYLGLGLGDIVSEDSDDVSGAWVRSVEPGAPASKAGFRVYDVVTEFNGKKIRNSTELTDQVGDTTPGTKVPVKIVRQEGNRQRKMDLSVVIGERPTRVTGRATKAPTRPDAPEGDRAPNNLGFRVADPNQELVERWELPADTKKPLIVDIEPGSLAAFVGLQPGDLILEVNKVAVVNSKDVVKNVKKSDNTIKIARGDRIIVVSLKQ